MWTPLWRTRWPETKRLMTSHGIPLTSEQRSLQMPMSRRGLEGRRRRANERRVSFGWNCYRHAVAVLVIIIVIVVVVVVLHDWVDDSVQHNLQTNTCEKDTVCCDVGWVESSGHVHALHLSSANGFPDAVHYSSAVKCVEWFSQDVAKLRSVPNGRTKVPWRTCWWTCY